MSILFQQKYVGAKMLCCDFVILIVTYLIPYGRRVSVLASVFVFLTDYLSVCPIIDISCQCTDQAETIGGKIECTHISIREIQKDSVHDNNASEQNYPIHTFYLLEVICVLFLFLRRSHCSIFIIVWEIMGQVLSAARMFSKVFDQITSFIYLTKDHAVLIELILSNAWVLY